MNFEQLSLDPRIGAGVKAAGYTTPTPIQDQAIPAVLAGRDVLGLAQTDTGKTAAFPLPILQRLTEGPLRQVRALIIVPTRELAEQIHQMCTELGKDTQVHSVTVYGGVSRAHQVAALLCGAEIVVGCPGRLLDLLGDGSLDLSRVEVLVLDEADRMCDMGFLPDIRRVLKVLPAQRQTLFSAATMPEDIRVTDGIYAGLAGTEVRQRIAGLADPMSVAPAVEGNLAELVASLSQAELSQVLHAVASRVAGAERQQSRLQSPVVGRAGASMGLSDIDLGNLRVVSDHIQ